MFIILPSASDYAQFLGGNAVFAGLIIGITSLFAGIAIPGLMAVDKGRSCSNSSGRLLTMFCTGTYMGPVIFSCVLATIGNVLYGLAYVRLAVMTANKYTNIGLLDRRLPLAHLHRPLRDWDRSR